MVDDTKARQTAQDMKETVRAEAARTGETVKGEAKALADEASSVGRAHAEQRFEQGRGAIEEQVGTIHSAIDGAAKRLHEENSPLASYADELSGHLSRFSSNIENSSLDDIAVKTRQVARENPGLFILGSVVVGIAAGRFFKASSSRDHDRDEFGSSGYDGGGYGTGGGGDDYRAGREAAMASYRTDYRSPAVREPAPYRPGATGGVVTETPTPRVPMDSTLASPTSGGTTPTGTTGGTDKKGER